MEQIQNHKKKLEQFLNHVTIFRTSNLSSPILGSTSLPIPKRQVPHLLQAAQLLPATLIRTSGNQSLRCAMRPFLRRTSHTQPHPPPALCRLFTRYPRPPVFSYFPLYFYFSSLVHSAVAFFLASRTSIPPSVHTRVCIKGKGSYR